MKFKAIGHIIRPHGLEGKLIIAVATHGSDEIRSLKYLYFGSNNNPEDVLEIEEITHYKKETYCVKAKGIDSSSLAERLKSKKVFMPANDEIVPDEPEDITLEGFEVFDAEKNEYLGIVNDVLEYPGQILLSVRRDNGLQFMVPYVDEFIDSIDETKGIIYLSLIEGLIDEN